MNVKNLNEAETVVISQSLRIQPSMIFAFLEKNCLLEVLG